MSARLTQVAAAVRFMLGDWTPNAQTVKQRLRCWGREGTGTMVWPEGPDGDPVRVEFTNERLGWHDDAWNRFSDPARRTSQRGQSNLVDTFAQFKALQFGDPPRTFGELESFVDDCVRNGLWPTVAIDGAETNQLRPGDAKGYAEFRQMEARAMFERGIRWVPWAHVPSVKR